MRKRLKTWKTLVWSYAVRNQKGIGTLEMLMILAVLVTIALIFREWVMNWVGDVLKDVKPTQPIPVHHIPTPLP